MKFDIGLTNGGPWYLDVGGSRLNNYQTLEQLFKDLQIILKIHIRKEN